MTGRDIRHKQRLLAVFRREFRSHILADRLAVKRERRPVIRAGRPWQARRREERLYGRL